MRPARLVVACPRLIGLARCTECGIEVTLTSKAVVIIRRIRSAQIVCDECLRALDRH